MKTSEEFKEIIDEIKLLISYAVGKEDIYKAESLLERYRANGVALTVLKEFYSSLPEAREEPVIRIAHIDMHMGVFLLGVSTGAHDYVFFATGDNAGSLGEFSETRGDEEIFSFFGYSDKEIFLQNHPNMAALKDLAPILPTNKDFCPVCSAVVGENHHLGCPVEVCPWCFGQLSKCNCRFEQMDLEEIVNDKDLERFGQLLEEKGRIPFECGQGPSYPAGGKDKQ